MKRYCTTPDIFGFREWFEKRFHYICEEHDKDYTEMVIPRRAADRKVLLGMIEKDYLFFGLFVYFYLRAFGWFYWYYVE